MPINRQEKIRVEPLEPATWRVVHTPPLDGATNMALDEAISESVASGASLPTLRFYQWAPACLSLGMAQSAETVDFERCAERGWHVVRRPTGGRAVLHGDELTYMLCAPDTEPRVKGGVLASYRRLSVGLQHGLKAIGLEPERAQSYYEDGGTIGPACFDGPSDYEITIGQRKLIGSAQMRKRGVVLQHGSLPLVGDITRVVDGLALEVGQRMALRSRLRYRATTLAVALGHSDSIPNDVAAKLQQGMAGALAINFVASEITAEEKARAETIRQEKYANDAWTLKR